MFIDKITWIINKIGLVINKILHLPPNFIGLI